MNNNINAFLFFRPKPEGVSSFYNKALTSDDNEEDEVDGARYSGKVHTSHLFQQDDDTNQEHNDQAQSDDELLENTKEKSKIGNIFKMVSD